MALAGCASLPTDQMAPAAVPAPQARTTPSQASLDARKYYAAVQRSLLAQGLLRTDGGGPDSRFTARMLARDFLRIALRQEYTERTGRLLARESGSVLHRWGGPIRYQLRYDPLAPPENRTRDTREITRYTARLQRLTGVKITPATTGTAANMNIFIVSEDTRRLLGPQLRALVPGISNATLNSILKMDRDTYCLALAVTPENSPIYERAIIIIRAEHQDLMRRACIHEEMAQAMGLPNDSPEARPSIFNDDGEFGLLTAHDELLLRMLYDRRLKPGMTEAQVRPIVEQIAAELMGGPV